MHNRKIQLIIKVWKRKQKQIRLIYPQWQGGDIARWITEIKDPEAASKGYFLGAELLNFLAPDSSQETLTVPISTEITERRKKDGVLDRDIIVKQTKAALDLLRISDPDKIVTLGGECSVSVVPFTYLAEKYKDDVAMIWIDAHPDITLPGRYVQRIPCHGCYCLHGERRQGNPFQATGPNSPLKDSARRIA